METERGPAGGYRLRRGFKLPPLMLSNEEALVMIIGLLAAQRLGLSASGTAVQGALAKLDRLLPETQRAQVQAMQDFVSLGLSPAGRDHADAATILQPEHRGAGSAPGSASRTGRRRARRPSESSTRTASRSRVATGTWSAWTTFETRFERSGSIGWWRPRGPTRPSSVRRISTSIAYLRQAIGEAVYGTRCEVLLDLSLEEARKRVSPTDGTLEAGGGRHGAALQRGRLRVGGVFLAGLECDLVVLQPPELRTSLRALASRLRDSARAPRRDRAGMSLERREAADTGP